MSKEEQLVDLDEGENWTVTFRKIRLKEMGWIGSLSEWLEAKELLDANPLTLDPPVMSLDAAKKRANR